MPRHKRVADKKGWLIIMALWKPLVAECAAAGGQADKACEVFEQMKYTGCRPDVVTYSALISAYNRSGQWHSAVRTFEQMQQHNCKPDSYVYQTVIDCLWGTGVAWAQARAWQLYVSATRSWQFRFTAQQANSSSSPGELEYVLPANTPGVGLLALRKWVGDLVGPVESDSVLLGAGRERMVLSLGRSKHARESSSSSAGQTLLAVLAGLKSPFR
jgi:pentatricopeptide repeat domain-containing protein 1